ncbi:MAG: helix-turn-helix domain-containing protein [Ruminococcaceae bacterium]|nr:helix-turn-helix domain-containing protein [Oscillospiraceae bacterium]
MHWRRKGGESVLYRTQNEIADCEKIRLCRKTEDGVCPAHRHEFVELCYVLAGCGTQRVDERVYEVKHGDLLFIDPGQTHEITAAEPMTYVDILLEPAFFSEKLMDTESITHIFRYCALREFSGEGGWPAQCVRFRGEERVRADRLVEILLTEYDEQRADYLPALRGGVQMLFVWMVRKLGEDTPETVNAVVEEALEYIDTHFAEKLTLRELAAKGFYSADHLSRLLKQACGESFSEYLKRRRIDRAAQLLAAGGASVADVMAQCGYNDPKLFYRHFKERHGVSPRKFAE